jgi:NAD-dependent deacetylase
MPQSSSPPKPHPDEDALAVVPQHTPSKDAVIVILTGAGISKESGLDTFRDADGIWSKVRWEDVATPEAFARDPERVHAFYNMRRARTRALDIKPNAAHVALARLEAEWPGRVLVVTQNVDSLHERAGSTNLIHMHGIYAKARCNLCGDVVDWQGDMSVHDVCAGCQRPGGLRPNVVWFGETPMGLDEIQEALAVCDVFISIGTSGNVYPAAGFVAMARQLERAHTVELNLEPSSGAPLFHESHHGPASIVVPTYVDGLLSAL